MAEDGRGAGIALGRTYKTKEFGALAGITARALNHYDRLGLLKARRTAAGYRVYEEDDLARLEQIVALKFIGFPLREIGGLLKRASGDSRAALRAQRAVLKEKRRRLDLAIRAIEEAEGSADPQALRKIMEALQMQEDPNWMMKYYSEEAAAKVESRRREWTPELQAEAEKDWSDLFRDVGAALECDPKSETAQALAGRWKKLIEGFTGGDGRVMEGLKAVHADRANWPASARERMQPFGDPRVIAFIQKALGAG
jgi:DNA-binding transcriptional MerR regulator